MSESEILTATEASRAFSDVLHRVCYGGESFVIKKGQRLMARIVPVEPVMEPEVIAAEAERTVPISENQIFKSLLADTVPSAPSNLTQDEAEYFKTVIEQLRRPELVDL